MKKIIAVTIIYLCVGCATNYPNEHEAYIGIKGEMAKEHYAQANLDIMDFKKKYPESTYICELLQFELAYRKNENLSTKDEQEVFNNKCENAKSKK